MAVALGLSLIYFNVVRLQSSEHNRSLDDLDEEENHVLPPGEDSQATQELQEDHGPPQVIRCGGEDGENDGTMSQRQRLNADMLDSSLSRRGRGKTVVIDSLYSNSEGLCFYSEEYMTFLLCLALTKFWNKMSTWRRGRTD